MLSLKCPLKITRSNVLITPEMDEPCTSRKLFMAAPMAIVVVYRHASLDILSPQVKSAPPQGSCLWLRPQAALWRVSH